MKIIAGKYKNRKLIAPKNDVRPTTGAMKEALFNICQSFIENSQFLDLFAGSGAVGIEALSRGASHVDFVENHRSSLQTIQKNLSLLNLEQNTTIYPINVLSFLKKPHSPRLYDIIWADPPYQESDLEALVNAIDQSSFLKNGGYFFLETSEKNLELPLSSLKLEKIRRFGKSFLYQFKI